MKSVQIKERYRKIKHIHSTLRIVLSFFLVILIGSLLLTLPACNHDTTSYINHLFIATSAVCVTGLVPVTTALQYTRLGQIVIIALIQIGGLGFLTFYSVMITTFSKHLSYSNKIVMQEALNQNSMNSLKTYIQRVVKYTFFIEFIGALLLSIQFIPEYGILNGIYYSIFHSISAFCNAGFDVLGSNSLCNYSTNILVNLVICGLIISGGLGFVVWIDLREVYRKCKKKYKVIEWKTYFKSLSVHSKIVLIMTSFLLISGTLIIFILERENVLKGYGIGNQLLMSFFQSTTLRTAGFATIDYAALRLPTKIIMCLYMLIGGSPAGCAGGIKTVTFALVCLYIFTLLRGKEKVQLFKRRISDEVVQRSILILTISMMIITTAMFIMSISESVPFIDMIFEIYSAIATVGLSCGVTPLLTVVGKIVIIMLMFIGRVGPLSIVMLVASSNNKKGNEILYTQENVIIG